MTKIYFHVDEGSMPVKGVEVKQDGTYSVNARSYMDTWLLIERRVDEIHTTDMTRLSFDLIDLGYEVYLCYKDKQIKMEPYMKMEYCEKELRPAHNILKIFMAGVFDDDLGIDFKDNKEEDGEEKK